MRNRKFTATLAILLFTSNAAFAADWPQWRGPTGTGIAPNADLPIVWNEGRNIRWKTSLPAWGTSTPAIWGDAVFVTSHVETRDGGDLVVQRINKANGQVAWKKNLGRAAPVRRAGKSERGVQTFHRWHNLASPSPVADGQRVVVHFGNGLLAALSFDGQLLWQRNLQDDHGDYTIWWGHANSPILYDGLVISACMQDSVADLRDKPAARYLIAHDLRDGHVRWKTERPTAATAEQCDSYTTPLLTEVNGQPQVVIMGGNQLDGYDPSTGSRLWFLDGLVGGRTITGPTIQDGIIYCTRGMRKDMLAVKLAGARVDRRGEIDRRDVLWTYATGTPDSCTPVLWHDLLFFVSDDGIARCLDAEHGKLHWKQRLKGQYKASPIACGGRIYFLNTEGLCTIVSAAQRFDKLTENQLDDETIASPAVSDGAIFLRGKQSLYCISK